jgi:D-alanyl-D-alanine endopeptidase (penicillin-binding protein 7)
MGNIFKKTLLGLVISSTFGIVNADEISAQSWLIANEQGEIISGKNTTEVRSIASITKLMTAMVVIDSGQSLDERIPKKLYGTHLTRRQLITLAIVKSDNMAAKYLCDYYPGGFNACIAAMNAKAMSLYMTNTTFTDSTGLMYTNVSTAEDLVKLLAAASKYEAIQEDSNKNVVSWQVNKKQKIVFRNTNPIVANERFAVSKTGYISKAGGCIAMIVSTIQGTKTIIILGSKTIKDRIPEARILISKL